MNSNIEIKPNGNVYSGDELIGSVCHKPQNHWTAYLATETGDEVLGQYQSKKGAAMAVEVESCQRLGEDILAAFQGARA